MDIHDKLKKRRQELNLSLNEVAKRLEISKTTMSRYESGAIEQIPYDKITKLTKILETTPGWLLGWESLSISEAEKSLIENYRDLDEYGKSMVGCVIEIEKCRCKGQKKVGNSRE